MSDLMSPRAADSEPAVVVVPDQAEVAHEAAARIAETLTAAVEARGRADWATTGGSMAAPIYRALAAEPARSAVPWASVHVWWGDDRYVPRDHPQSNVRPFDDILLSIAWTQGGQVALGQSGESVPVGLQIANVHAFPTNAAIAGPYGAAWCAAQLADELRVAGPPARDGWPVFDLVLLGIGSDGHVLSVFPGSEAFESRDLALAVPAPTHIEPHLERVTLNPAVLSVARSVMVVAAGESKAAILADALRGDPDPRRLPAQLGRNGKAVWILDTAAAARLDQASG